MLRCGAQRGLSFSYKVKGRHHIHFVQFVPNLRSGCTQIGVGYHTAQTSIVHQHVQPPP